MAPITAKQTEALRRLGIPAERHPETTAEARSMIYTRLRGLRGDRRQHGHSRRALARRITRRVEDLTPEERAKWGISDDGEPYYVEAT